jgi:hypothetical protein
LGSVFLLVDGWNPFFITQGWSRSIPIQSVSLHTAGWYFLPLGSKYSCWWMVGNPFLYYAGIQCLHPSRVESVCQLDDIFLPLGSKYSCWRMVGILFFITQGYSLRSIPIQSSLPAGRYFLP